MFTCPACVGHIQFTNGDTYLAHFSFFHSKLIASGDMTCTHSECIGRKFDKYNSFRKHVRGKHGSSFHTQLLPGKGECNGSGECESTRHHPAVLEEMELGCTPEHCEKQPQSQDCHINHNVNCNNSVKFDEALTNAVVTYIANLYDNGSFNESQIQFIIDSHMQLLGSGFLSILKEKVQDLLSKVNKENAVSDHDVGNVCRMFDSCQNMFQGFETHYLRLKEIENCGAYIKPESFVISHAQDVHYEDGHAVIQPIQLTGQFVPFKYVLKGFLELPGILHNILSYMNHLESTCSDTEPNSRMESVCQGELWRKKVKPKFNGKCVMPLIFNFDDMETNKELGTHTGVHKLGAGYLRLACLPPKFMSALENIFLVLLIHSGDRACGNDKVFRKVISELEYLEKTGISVVLPEETIQVYFALFLVTGDNLGANGILGYVESFSANYFCRVCYEKSSTTKFQTEANPEKRRTPESYANDLAVNNETMTGRKGVCVFNELESYDVTENVHVDTMHDLDEGVWRYLMYAIIRYLYGKKRFTIDHLNELIQGFYYGANEERNRPPYITQDDLIKFKRLRLSASEMRCLVRYFGLMVGHLIKDEDQDVWTLYLKARKILDIVSSPFVRKADADNLKKLIKEHHTMYMDLFETHLQPKFHIMLHEPDLLVSLGPLEPLSCYRTEDKHREGKNIAHNSNSRINLPFTIMKRHQLRLAFRFLSGRGFSSKFEYSALQMIPAQNLKDFPNFLGVIPDDELSKVWNTVKWLSVNGAKYVIDSVVLHSLRNREPVFGQVKVISILQTDVAYLVLKYLKVIKFDDHFHAYEVEEGNEWMFVNYQDLLTYVPTDIRFCPNGKSYVPFRFALTCFDQ